MKIKKLVLKNFQWTDCKQSVLRLKLKEKKNLGEFTF